MDSVYRMLGAVGGCGWQLCPLGWCLEANLMVAQPSPASLLQPNVACLDASWPPLGLYIIVFQTMVFDRQWIMDLCFVPHSAASPLNKEGVNKPNIQDVVQSLLLYLCCHNFFIMC